MSRSRKTKKKAIRTRPSTNQLRRTFFGKNFPVLHPCGYCGIVSRYEMDHIIAFAKHGSNSKANLTPSCERCNRTKSKKTLLQWFRGLTTRKLNKIIQHNKGNKSSFAKKIKETHMKQNNMTRKGSIPQEASVRRNSAPIMRTTKTRWPAAAKQSARTCAANKRKRSEAAKKAARTRAANKRKRSEAAKKAARTRAANKRKRS